MGDDLRQAEFDARYRSLLANYLSELPQRRDAVAASWSAAKSPSASSAWRDLHVLAHRLAGSAPCYGLDAVGEAAQEIDRLLSQKPPCRDVSTLGEPMSRLLAELNAAVSAHRTDSIDLA